MMRGELERAKHHAQEMRHFGDAPDNVMWKCIGSLLSGNVCFWYGEFIDARSYYENALSSWNPKFRTFAGAPVDPYVSILSLLYLNLVCLGDVNQARLRRDEALAEARRLSPYNLTFTLGNISLGDWLLVGSTSTRTFLMLADEILTLSREQGFPLYVGYGTVIRGWGMAVLGQAMQGIPLVLEGLEIARATGVILQVPILLAMLADTYRIAGQPEDGLNRLAETTKLVETTQQRWAQAEIHRLRGALLLSMRDHAAAEDSFQHAMALAQQQSAKLWELRAALELTRLWRDQRKRTEARDLLAPVFAWFTEGFDTPVLQEARALLDQLA
jgi:tetratricopeptide (TPR) repeat protein